MLMISKSTPNCCEKTSLQYLIPLELSTIIHNSQRTLQIVLIFQGQESYNVWEYKIVLCIHDNSEQYHHLTMQMKLSKSSSNNDQLSRYLRSYDNIANNQQSKKKKKKQQPNSCISPHLFLHLIIFAPSLIINSTHSLHNPLSTHF